MTMQGDKYQQTRLKHHRKHPTTEKRRQEMLAKLKAHSGEAVSRKQLGLSRDEAHNAAEWLKAEGHNILALAKGGYMLLDGTPAETINMRRLDRLESIVLELAHRIAESLSRPAVPVPASAGMLCSDSLPVPKKQPGTGNRRSTIPTDTVLLIDAIKEAAASGIHFTKTGGRGVYERRGELPEEFSIGKHRLEGIVSGLIAAGTIRQGEGGRLFVPVSNSQ